MASIKARLHSEEIVLPDDTYATLDRFAAMLHEWNRVHNLTGAHTIEAIGEHIVDALYPLTFIDLPKRLLDVGTGAGFPGLVLAIAIPQTAVTLCEPIRKRVSFLRYAALSLELSNVTVEAKRVETMQAEQPFDLITSRAVTDTKLLLDLTRHLACDTTRYLFYKGSRVTRELENIEENLRYDMIRYGLRNYLYIKGNDAT